MPKEELVIWNWQILQFLLNVRSTAFKIENITAHILIDRTTKIYFRSVIIRKIIFMNGMLDVV